MATEQFGASPKKRDIGQRVADLVRIDSARRSPERFGDNPLSADPVDRGDLDQRIEHAHGRDLFADDVRLVGQPAVLDPTAQAVVDQHRDRMLTLGVAKSEDQRLLATVHVPVAKAGGGLEPRHHRDPGPVGQAGARELGGCGVGRLGDGSPGQRTQRPEQRQGLRGLGRGGLIDHGAEKTCDGIGLALARYPRTDHGRGHRQPLGHA